MKDLFDGPADLVVFLAKVAAVICFALAYILTCTTLAGISQ